MGRFLGLDIGDARIGVAISDALLITAQGRETYERKSIDDDIIYFKDIIQANDISAIICGLPKNMDGSIGEQAKKTVEYGSMLHERTGLPVEYWDERLTTKSAQRVLSDADVGKKKRKKIVDKIAAVYILQSYLESIR